MAKSGHPYISPIADAHTSPGYTTGGVLVAPDALPCPYHPVGVPQQCASADVTSANNRKRDTIIPHSLTLKQSEPEKNQFRRITGSETKNLDREVVSDCQLKATLSHFEMRGPGFRYSAVTEVKQKKEKASIKTVEADTALDCMREIQTDTHTHPLSLTHTHSSSKNKENGRTKRSKSDSR